MKVLISDNLHAKGWPSSRQPPTSKSLTGRACPREEFMEVVQDVDGLVIRSATKVTDKVLEVATRGPQKPWAGPAPVWTTSIFPKPPNGASWS